MPDHYIEILGYMGTALVVASFLGTSMIRLRLLNFVGAAVITLYALLIGAWPMVLLNALLAVINGYHYFLLLRKKQIPSKSM